MAGASSSRSNAMELGSMSGGQNPPCVFSAFCNREHEKVHTGLLCFIHTRAHVCASNRTVSASTKMVAAV